MSSPIIQLLVLAGIAVFLILRLRSVLGTREGFEKPPAPRPTEAPRQMTKDWEVIDGGPDRDINDHVPENSPAASALAGMKRVDRSFVVRDFLQGARGAYEMILMAFEKGDLSPVAGFLSDDVRNAFEDGIATRKAEGLTIEATFAGISDIGIQEVEFDRATEEAEISIRFMGELNYLVRNSKGEIVEGSATEIRRQRDVWTFARKMGSNDPNWRLVATSE